MLLLLFTGVALPAFDGVRRYVAGANPGRSFAANANARSFVAVISPNAFASQE